MYVASDELNETGLCHGTIIMQKCCKLLIIHIKCPDGFHYHTPVNIMVALHPKHPGQESGQLQSSDTKRASRWWNCYPRQHQ
jgi:hypothetical protein